MEARNVDITPAFTFVWVIENCPKLLTPEGIKSPKFAVNSIENTTWNLALKDLDKDTFSYSIHRKNDSGPDIIEIVCELQFLANVELLFKKEHRRVAFAIGDSLKFQAPFDSIFDTDIIQYLENDTLTLRCRIWKVGMHTLEPNFCCARTRLGLERKTVFWHVQKFNALLPKHPVHYQIESNVKGAPPLNLAFYIRNVYEEDYAYIKILGNGEIKFLRFNCEFSVMDVNGRKYFTQKVAHMSTANDEHIRFFQKKKLMNHEMNLVPGDSLTIRCEFEIGSGTTWNRMEFYAYPTLLKKDVVS